MLKEEEEGREGGLMMSLCYFKQVEVFAFPNNGTPLAGPSPPLGNAWSFGVPNAEALYNDSIGVYNSVMNVTASGTQVWT